MTSLLAVYFRTQFLSLSIPPFQNGREANPKAAYQFGLKPTEGRKTRKSVDVNKKLDRELNQISQINEKRKADIEAGTYKKPKY